MCVVFRMKYYPALKVWTVNGFTQHRWAINTFTERKKTE